jgi:hypothetical protein
MLGVAVAEMACVATGTIGTEAMVTGTAGVGVMMVECLMLGLCLLKSSSIACWSAFFKPYDKAKNNTDDEC